MDVESATKALETWDDACKELDIPHLLIYGTCLGFHREGDFIKGDSDIDTRVICNKEKWKKLVDLLGEKGIVQDRSNIKGWAFSGNGVPLSIERSEKVGEVIKGDGTRHNVMPLYYKFDVHEYKGRKYNLPHPIEEYLEGRYGKNWRTPVDLKKWDNKKDVFGG